MDLATLMFIAYRAMDDQVIRGLRDAGFEVTTAQSRIAQRIAVDGSRLTDLAEQADLTASVAARLPAVRAGQIEL